MSLAALGAAVALAATALVEATLRRDFGAEIAESVRVKDRRPLGEEAILRALRRRARERGDDDTRS
jgi:putative membrane protein